MEFSVLVDAVRAAGGLIEEIVGHEVATPLMAELVRRLGIDISASDRHWAYWMSCFSEADFAKWPGVRLLEDMRTYAFEGVLNPECDFGSPVELVGAAETLLSKVPGLDWRLGLEDAIRTLAAARARKALDFGERLEPSGLAVLGGVSEGRLRNLIADNRKLLTVREGKVSNASALRWLSARPSFRPSTWRDSVSPAATNCRYREPVFVPETFDGEVFQPGIGGDGDFFVVGRGEGELKVQGFDAALDVLTRMDPPTWRRKSPGGRWTHVTGIRWIRVERAEMDGYRSPRADLA